MKRLIPAILIFIVQAAGAIPQRGQAPQNARPNILFILADDMGAEASALYPQLYNSGAPAAIGQVATPTLSALAGRGIVFDNVWATPLCSPTRGAVLSGLYGHNTGVTTVGNILPGATTSIFELIAGSPSAAPYKMGVFGKWHLGGANMNHVVKETGVPFFKGFLGSHLMNNYSWNLDSSTGPSVNTTEYSTTALTNFAIDFIKGQSGSEPWFVYLPYGAPHGTAPSDGFQVPPANLFKVEVGGRPAGQSTVYSGNTAIPVYQAMIQALDTEIGRLLRAVDDLGELTNTVVIFLGDNGTPASVKDPASRIRGSKSLVYEGGVRVPMIVAGPGVTRTGRESHIVAATDLYATIAQLAGVSLASNTINNSHSLVGLFTNDQASTGRKYSFTELCSNTGAATAAKMFAIRDQRHKLLYSRTTWEMFDLQNDPWETTNIYDNPAHSNVRAALLAELSALQKKAATSGCFVPIPEA